MAQAGLRGGSFDELAGLVLREVGDTLDVPDVVLLQVESSWEELRGRAALFGGNIVDGELVRRVRVPSGRGSMAGFTVLLGVPVVSPDLTADTRFELRGPEYGIASKAAITAPVGLGERPWGVLVVYSPEVRPWTDEEGAYVTSIGAAVGLAASRILVESELRDAAARLDLSLEAGGMGAWTWDVVGELVEMSEQAREICGIEAPFDGDPDTFMGIVHPEDRAILRSDVYEAMQTSGEAHNVFRAVGPDGDVRWLESWGRLLGGSPSLRLVGVITDITERQLAEETREALLVREQQARVAAERAHQQMATLAGAGIRFSATFDVAEVVDILADTCVPALADACLVDLMDDDGRLVERAAVAHTEAALADVRALRERRGPLEDRACVYSEGTVAQEQVPVLLPSIEDSDFERSARDAEHLALIQRFDARSAIVVPLVSRGRVQGVISLLLRGRERSYGPDDLAFIETLAVRGALAIDNARLYAARNRVARALQAALLPPALPEVPGLELAARYRVAEADTEIGGDFYDVVEVGGGAVGVVVGDVCGRGPEAAALTGLVRHSVRTAVMREQIPSRVLALTNDAVLGQIDDARFCTAAFLRVDPAAEPSAAVEVVASSAGHPRPVLLRADGRASFVDCAGLLLGVVPSPRLVDLTLRLEPGDAIVLYTDGVTEARREGDLFGDERLLDAVRGLAGRSAEGLAAGLEAAVVDFQKGATDDVAIVVVRVSDGNT